MAWLNVYQYLKQIVQDAIAPEIQGIKGELKSLQTQISGLQAEVAELRNDLRSFEARVDKRFEEQNRHWELAMEVRERLASLEAQIRRR